MRLAPAALAIMVSAFLLEGFELRWQGCTEVLTFLGDASAPRLPAPPLPPELGPREPVARNAWIFLLDGLRDDVASTLPAFQELAPRGARLRAQQRWPVYSVPARSLLVTGAPPEVTGLVGNGRKAGAHIDHLMKRASLAGMSVEGDRWEDWLGLAPFPRERGARTLRIEDWFDCDHEGHLHGASSPEYARAASDVSTRLLERVAKIDLEKDVVLAISDHGHTATGGHLGLEPDVAVSPVLLIGRGVKPVAIEAPVPMEDVGATLSVLLGVGLPELHRGVPVVAALTTSIDTKPWVERRAALARSWDEGVPRTRTFVVRGAVALVGFLLVVAMMRPRIEGALGAAAIVPVLTGLAWAFFVPPMSANGGWRWLVPEYYAAFAVGLGPSIIAKRALRIDTERFARALVVVWAIPVAAMFARVGIAPEGLEPIPLAFVLALASGFLGHSALFAWVLARFAKRSEK